MTRDTDRESQQRSCESILCSPLDEGYLFRVLKLLPGEHDEELRGELQVRELDEDGLTYEAISYTWGKKLDGDICVINDKPTPIGTHLGDALRRIRPVSHERFLWVDAICIDQVTTSERNHQVSLMAEIFSGAVRVLVWLGENSDGSNELMDKIRATLPVACSTAGQRSRGQHARWTRATHKEFAANFSEGLWSKRLLDLLHREYWSRTWVWQEIALARKVLFLCGNKSITLDEFDACIESIRETYAPKVIGRSRSSRQEATIDIVKRSSGFSLVSDLISIAITNQVLSLHALLMKIHITECLDVRDRVFGILGLVNEAHRDTTFKPDYSLTQTELFFSVLKYCNQPHDVMFTSTLMQKLQVSSSDILSKRDEHPTVSFPRLRCSSLKDQLTRSLTVRNILYRANWILLAPETRLSSLKLRKSRRALEFFAEVTPGTTVCPCDMVLHLGNPRLPPDGMTYFLAFEMCHDSSMKCKFKYLAIHDAPVKAGIEDALNSLMPQLRGCEIYLKRHDLTIERLEMGLEAYLAMVAFHMCVASNLEKEDSTVLPYNRHCDLDIHE